MPKSIVDIGDILFLLFLRLDSTYVVKDFMPRITKAYNGLCQKITGGCNILPKFTGLFSIFQNVN